MATIKDVARLIALLAEPKLPITKVRELARVIGLSRPEAGLGNRALVAEGFALSPARGVYHLLSGPTS